MKTTIAVLATLALCACPTVNNDPDGGGAEDSGTSGETDAGFDAGGGDCATDENHACVLHPGCGCDDGQTCDLDPANEALGYTVCRPAGVVTKNSPCVPGNNECAEGLICVGQPTGLCREYCSTHDDCGTHDWGNFCRPVLAGSGISTAIPGASTCSTFCNPFDPQDDTGLYSGCPADVACKDRGPVGNAGEVSPPTTDCTLADATKLEGDPCNVFCAPGLMCLPDEATVLRCQRPCEVCTLQSVTDCTPDAGPTICATGSCTRLNALFGSSSATPQELGYCKLPAN